MSSTCYARNGSLYTDPTDPVYIPCNSTAIENGQHSACCAGGDLCLTNGMCYNGGDAAKGANHYWRVGCTDPTFNDPACPKFCTGKEDPGHLNALIFDCQKPRSYCCGPPGSFDHASQGVDTSCCSNSSLTFQADDALVYTTARALVPHVTSSANIPSATLATLVTSIAAASSSSISHTALPLQTTSVTPSTLGVSLGVGLSLGSVGVALTGVIIYLVRRRRSERAELPTTSSVEKLASPSVYPHYAEAPGNIYYEVGGSMRVELDGHGMPLEMHGDRR